MSCSFAEIIEDDNAPDWAKEAFFRAINSVPLLAAIFKEWVTADTPEFFRGVATGAVSDVWLPLMTEVSEFAEKKLQENPDDPNLINQRNSAVRYQEFTEKSLRNVLGDFGVAQADAKKKFFSGFEAWQKKRPANFKDNPGNLATLPNADLAVF